MDGLYTLANSPNDGISATAFSPENEDLLLVSSWDSTARLYNVRENSLKSTFEFGGASLSCCFNSTGTTAFTAGLDNSIYSLDLSSQAKSVIGAHNGAVSCLEYSSHANALISGSWDETVKFSDPRCAAPTVVSNTPGKVYSLSTVGSRVVVATSNRHVLVYDIRQLEAPQQIRESPLRHQTRRVACSPEGQFFAISSTEGRIGIEYFDLSAEQQSKKYAFKCHRKGDLIFPISALAFHPIYGTFATGGSDSIVNIWDGLLRKRLTQLPAFPSSISALSFSKSGAQLAISSSYMYESGPKPSDADLIFIKKIEESEVRFQGDVSRT